MVRHRHVWDGRTWVPASGPRVARSHGVRTGVDGRLASRVLPRNWSVPDPKNPGQRIRLAPRYAKDGTCQFQSVAEIRETVARAQSYGEQIAWDPEAYRR